MFIEEWHGVDNNFIYDKFCYWSFGHWKEILTNEWLYVFATNMKTCTKWHYCSKLLSMLGALHCAPCAWWKKCSLKVFLILRVIVETSIFYANIIYLWTGPIIANAFPFQLCIDKVLLAVLIDFIEFCKLVKANSLLLYHVYRTTWFDKSLLTVCMHSVSDV